MEKGKQQILNLAKKIKALADRGEGGEKFNAELKLKSLMDQYGITMDELVDDPVCHHEIKIHHKQTHLFHQIVAMVMGRDFRLYTLRNRPTNYVFDCTKSKFLELKMMFDFYWQKWVDDLKLFYAAFVHKNQLFPVDPVVSESQPNFDELLKLQRMMNSMDKHEYQKRID